MASHYPTPKYIKFSHYPDIFTRDFSHYPQISAQLATSMHHQLHQLAPVGINLHQSAPVGTSRHHQPHRQLHLMSIRHFNKPLTINKLPKTILRLGTS